MASQVIVLVFSFTCLAGITAYAVAEDNSDEVRTTMNSMTELLNIPPYRVFSDYDRPANMNPSLYAQLQHIAAQNDMNISDLYQFYDMIVNNIDVSPQQVAVMIDQLASAFSDERRRVMKSPSIPTYVTNTRSPFTNSLMNKLQFPMFPHLRKREPAPANGLLSSVANDISSNMNAAYNNVMNFVEKMAPETSESLSNLVNNIVGQNIPEELESQGEQLSNKLNSNMRYMMAETMNTLDNLL